MSKDPIRQFIEGKIRPAKLQVIIMPNEEVLCAGIHIGWLTDKRPTFIDTDKCLKDFIEEEEE